MTRTDGGRDPARTTEDPGGPWRLTADAVPALAAGAALLGSGGGGDVSAGARLLRQALAAKGGGVPVVRADGLPPDTLVVHVGLFGAPDVLEERLFAAEDFGRALRAVEETVGRTAGAVGVIEIGGLNALTPPLTAAHLGLPVVDGDLMGRAFPRLFQTRPALHGRPAEPIAVVGPGGDTVVVRRCTARRAERLVRANAGALGGAAAIALYAVTAADLMAYGIPGSVGRCAALGAGFLAARDAPVDALCARLGARLLGQGRVDEMVPRDGTVPGSATLLDQVSGAVLRVDLLDEYLTVAVDGRTVAATPEVVVALDPAGRSPVRCDQLRPGRQVALLRLPPLVRWPRAADGLVGPAAYGLVTDREEEAG
ncbi:DUF917 domain-containing protein [Streptomyces sp. NPDC093252]|uniref:DUF917 domain-containing protein n=1 Tax=Streptomyces sp. NPDC093252 TaxID=3154980 RepID=UPI003446336B